MSKPKITILGAGPAGVGAAWRLAEERKADVLVLEQKEVVGGNAGSFEIAGIPVDFGSHRLHPACDPQILSDLKELLGVDLLDRPRHGRIRLQGKWISFPLRPLNLALNLPISFSSGVVLDAASKILSRSNGMDIRILQRSWKRVLGRRSAVISISLTQRKYGVSNPTRSRLYRPNEEYRQAQLRR